MSLAYAIQYRATDRTLTDEEVTPAFEHLLSSIKERAKAGDSLKAFAAWIAVRVAVHFRDLEARTMTKADLIEVIHDKVGLSKKESADIVELVFETMKQTLESSEKIKISGFGNFEVRNKNLRIGRNPKTGESIEISARRVLTFKPSQVLKASLNQ